MKTMPGKRIPEATLFGRFQRERESFKFGPGKQNFSEFAVIIPVWVAEGLAYCVRASVIKQDVPLLFSRKVLQGVGAVLEMESNRMTYGRLENKIVELHEVEDSGRGGGPARKVSGHWGAPWRGHPGQAHTA